MLIDRRGFMRRAGTVAAAAYSGAFPTRLFAQPAAKAILFDAFPIFDLAPVGAVTEQLFPGKGKELAALWRSRQFEYQWLRVLSHSYADFWTITEDSLVFACDSLKLPLADNARTRLMQAYLKLRAWPDVPKALQSLKQRGVRLGFLSNMTKVMLEANIRSAGLNGMFDDVISSDQIRSYKPDARVYELGLDVLKLQREEILFVAFAGWDAAGATTFGYPTFWCNRTHAPPERLGVAPRFVGSTLDDLSRVM
jgi:2-haloacid dehalogenase